MSRTVAGTGQLVVVTGATGSGKSTTCRKFVATADELWLHFGADHFLGQMVPRQYVDGGERCREAVHMEPDDPSDPDGPAHLSLGSLGAGLFHSLHEMVGAAVRSGQRVIMDHVTTVEPPVVQDCLTRWVDLPVLLVALRPSATVRDARIDARAAHGYADYDSEQLRRANDATKRASRFFERQIFSHDCFDLVIEDASMRPREIVAAIRTRMAEGPGTAFARLAQRQHW